MAGNALLAVQYERQYADSIDKDYKFTTAERTAYLSNPLRYAGQIVIDSDEDLMYRLNFAKTTWLPLGASAIPNQSGNSGKYLTTNGTAISWATINSLPTQTGNSGKYLTTDGSNASWNTVDTLPSQTSNSGKVLSTNGTTASWISAANTIVTGYVKATVASAITSANSILEVLQIFEKKIDDKKDIQVKQNTGTSLVFTQDADYGTDSFPETGNITASTTGAIVGAIVQVIHNSGVAPTFDSKFHKVSDSGDYVLSVNNYIICDYRAATKINYRIYQ